MSRFFSNKLDGLQPYVPGEQPRDRKYIKLNTNENPYVPSECATSCINTALLEELRLYSDPTCGELCQSIADVYGVEPQNVLPTNGSDEALAFCFAAFCGNGVVFPDVTYGFYKVFCGLFCAEYEQIPLNHDFTVEVSKYIGVGRTVVLANPNAQTGICLQLKDIERIVAGNPDNIVVIDEAYIDFGGESAVRLIDKYDNLVVVHTFSKSRALAGARVGYAIADEKLIADLNRVKYSFNPYNVNSISAALASRAVRDTRYLKELSDRVIATRAVLSRGLTELGYTVVPSLANFVLAKSPTMTGEQVYCALKQNGILVRLPSEPRISDYVRITIGTEEQTDALLAALKAIHNGEL